MDNISIPNPNPFITKWLLGAEAKKLVRRQAIRAQMIYRGIVAHRTGELAASTEVSTYVGGLRGDRWEARLTVRAPYAASHEFGTGRTDPDHTQTAARDLEKVIIAMDQL